MSKAYKVLKEFQDDHLIEIAKKKQFRINNDALAKSVADAVSAQGFNKFLQCLFKDQLETLTGGKNADKPETKNALIKKAVLQMNDQGAKKWWNGQDKVLLDQIAKGMDIEFEKGDNKGEVIISAAETIGLENCFSHFDIHRLHAFAEGAGLDIKTQSTDVIIECLVEHKNFVPKTKKKVEKKEVKKSKTKPKIDKDISTVDLNSWFYLQDLVDFCKTNDIDARGSKQVLIRNIRNHFDGKVAPKKRAASKERKGPATKKAKTTKGAKATTTKASPKKPTKKPAKKDEKKEDADTKMEEESKTPAKEKKTGKEKK